MRHTLFCGFLLLLWLPATGFSQKNAADATKVVTGTVLLDKKLPPDTKALLATLRADWGVRVDSVRPGDKTLVFAGPGGATVMIAWLDYPAPAAEIRAAADISMLWPGAAKEAGAHQAQAVISVIGSGSRTVELYKLFTRVAGALLDKSAASGIYLSGQYLLLSKGYFLASAKGMSDENLPLSCWVYFGVRQEGDTSSGYTYGLHEFGLPEFEVLQSGHTPQDVYALLTDAVNYVIRTHTIYREGQFFTTPDGQKIAVQVSKSTVLKNETTVKLKY